MSGQNKQREGEFFSESSSSFETDEENERRAMERHAREVEIARGQRVARIVSHLTRALNAGVWGDFTLAGSEAQLALDSIADHKRAEEREASPDG